MSSSDVGIRCSHSSLEACESLAATAPDGVTTWVVLEDGGRWGPDALASDGLPPPIGDRLAQLKALPGVRVILVRGRRNIGEDRRLWVARVGVDDEALWSWHLDRVEDLLDLPLLDVVRGRRRGPVAAGPLILVCTHGQRDSCCAIEGGPVAAALDTLAPGTVWRSSHLGGHRFAATALVLPLGLVYGRLRPDQAPALLESVQRRQIFSMEHFRGRSCWPALVQAAMHRFRLDNNENGLDAVHVIGRIKLAEDRWRVALTASGAGPVYCEYEVQQQVLDRPVLKSCGDAGPGTVRSFVARRVQ